MRIRPIVLDEGKLKRLQQGDRLDADNFSYLSIDFNLEIPEKQLMRTAYIEIESGASLDVLGALEIV